MASVIYEKEGSSFLRNGLSIRYVPIHEIRIVEQIMTRHIIAKGNIIEGIKAEYWGELYMKRILTNKERSWLDGCVLFSSNKILKNYPARYNELSKNRLYAVIIADDNKFEGV